MEVNNRLFREDGTPKPATEVLRRYAERGSS